MLTPCRVVGLALESLVKVEADTGTVEASQCSEVEFWNTRQAKEDGSWSQPKTCHVPVLQAHQLLALYIMQRLYTWLSGLGLVVADAIVPKTSREGSGDHDLKLKHALPQKQLYCKGFLSMEVKVSQVGVAGRWFARAWETYKEDTFAAMSRVLSAPGTIYGAAVLLVVGICDSEELLAAQPPLLVKAQLMTRGANGQARWSTVLLDRGLLPVVPAPPPPKRQRQGASWDEVRAILQGKKESFEGTEYVRLLDLFTAISPSKAKKSPGHKIATYEKHLGLKKRNGDYMQRRYPAHAKGSEPYWLTWKAASAIYEYEVKRPMHVGP